MSRFAGMIREGDKDMLPKANTTRDEVKVGRRIVEMEKIINTIKDEDK